jgi:hypothetical protein
MPAGRPNSYTPEIATKVCAELAMGRSLRSVCKQDDMPCIQSIFNWFHLFPEFVEQYARAKEESADAMAEEILAISDETEEGKTITVRGDGNEEVKTEDMLGHRRLKIDTRKWLMAKMKPKKYGDKLDMTSNGETLNVSVSTGTGMVPMPKKDS